MPAITADAVERVRRSPFFDGAWYRAAYSDLTEADLDLAWHYVAFGAGEGRDPGPRFRTLDYAALWPEVAAGEVNALVHFHEVLAGTIPLRDDRALVAGSALFDAGWYRRANPDVAAAGLDPLDHYLRFGAGEGRDPGPQFSASAYLALRPDAAAHPLAHFLRYGIADGIALTDLARSATPPVEAPRNGGRIAVFVVHDMNYGGAPRLVATLAAWFQRATDYRVRLVAMADGPLRAEFGSIAPLHVVGMQRVAPEAVPPLRDALHAFLGEEPAFTFVGSSAAGDYCRIDPFAAPTFAYLHEIGAVLDLFREPFEVLVDRARHVFCGGEAVTAAVLAARPDLAPRLSTQPPFIATPEVDRALDAADKADRRRRLGLRSGRPLVLGCGLAHWRKQPLAFVRIAGRLIRERGRDCDFVWIGDGDDQAAMQRLAIELGIADRVQLLGSRDDLRAWFAAADIFALTSSEDPFPLVCLEAGARSAPVVLFREASAVAGLVEPVGGEAGGAAVPLGDEAAFAAALDRLLGDEALRGRAGAALRARVAGSYVEDRAAALILARIREAAGLCPRVSIIVPRGDDPAEHDARLADVARQTFRDVELIVPEGADLAAWQHGLAAARGDIVWIAAGGGRWPADFLAEALAAFEPPGVRLVRTQAVAIGEGGRREPPAASVWSPAAREVAGIASIPDPGGVLVRRPAALIAIAAARAPGSAGERAFYLAAAHGGRVGYAAAAVSRYTPRSLPAERGHLQALADLGALVRHLYGGDPRRDDAFRRHLGEEARRLGHRGRLPAGRLPAEIAPRVPGLLYGLGDLAGGGAQTYGMRLVDAWTRLPAPAALFVTGNVHVQDHPGWRARLNPMVPVLTPAEAEAAGGFAALLAGYGIDVVVSGHWWADEAVGRYKQAERFPQPWVIVMHGCRETVLGQPHLFPGYERALAQAERWCDHWVRVADKNRLVFERGLVVPRAESRIVSGFAPPPSGGLSRRELGLPDDALVFLLAGRAIPEKGWRVALEAFAALRAAGGSCRELRLVLVGDGPVADDIRRAPAEEGVLALPHSARLDDHLALCDVCLVPSWFSGESLPLVLIEALAHGKPAIVSDIGMSGWAIDDGAAGLIVPRDGPEGSVRVEDLAAAMQRFVDDPGLAVRLRPAVRAAAAKFDMGAMVAEYRALFDRLLAGGEAGLPAAAAHG